MLEQHHRFADSVALFQVAIALGAVSALTRQRLVWGASGLLGLAGAGLLDLAPLTGSSPYRILTARAAEEVRTVNEINDWSIISTLPHRASGAVSVGENAGTGVEGKKQIVEEIW